MTSGSSSGGAANAAQLDFFWDRKHRKASRSRFNLLLLDFGEYFLEDFAAFHFPLPAGASDLAQGLDLQQATKIQGRLKLSSRSLLFEPNEVRYPLLKFPFKSLLTDLQRFHLTKHEHSSLSGSLTGCFTFLCASLYEMKAHNRVGPYKLVESPSAQGQRMLFALVHSDLDLFLVKVEQFRHICSLSDRQGSTVASLHLKPFLESALISSFDSSSLVDFHESLLLPRPLPVRRIRPLVAHPGSLMLTEQRVYFQPAALNNIAETTLSCELRKIAKLYKRRHMLRPTGLEIILQSGSSHFFVFDSEKERNEIYSLMDTHWAALCGGVQSVHVPLKEVTRRWQRREMSNFEYLMHLNNEAGRSLNDITQYPVFPHIIADYSSKKLNLSNPQTFRDLSKPIGALNAERLQFFKERFQSMAGQDSPPPFLYGTHYSTPGYVLYYLVRVAPEYMLCLQNGRFDAPDRLFLSLPDSYSSSLHNPADLKELIPEFFTGSGDFLVNSEDLDLGHKHSGERVHDVVLPPWAESARDFVRKHAKALESEYVSAHLHEWIDLIFGYKQRGQAALEADNLFYYLTYEGAVDLESPSLDPRERAALESQIQEFGQCPKVLFAGPHPPRAELNAPVPVTPALSEPHTNTASASSIASTASVPVSSSQGSDVSVSAKEITAGTEGSKQRSRSVTTVAPTPLTTEVPKQRSQSLLSVFTRSQKDTDSRTHTPTQTPTHRHTHAQQQQAPLQEESLSLTDTSTEVLGDDFRREVEKEMALSHTQSHTQSVVSGSAEPEADAHPSITRTNSRVEVDVSRVRLFPSECFYWHTKAVTSLSLRLSPADPPAPQTLSQTRDSAVGIGRKDSNVFLPESGRKRLCARLCSSGKDAQLKVVKIEQDLDLREYVEKSLQPSRSVEGVARTQCALTRSFSPSGSSLSAVCLSRDTHRALLASWDNHIYGYSIMHANSLGKRFAHYDSVTALCTDAQDKHVLSGSMDGTVKLWPLRAPHTSTSQSAHAQQQHTFLSSSASAELEDCEYPVHCVALSACGAYAAAGSEDGTLYVWHLATQRLLSQTTLSPVTHKAVTALCWLPVSSDAVPTLPSSNSAQKNTPHTHKLLATTLDGALFCIDANGRILSSTATGPGSCGFLSLASDGRIALCGASDGSLRVFSVVDSNSSITGAVSLREVLCVARAHSGAITAVALCESDESVCDGPQKGESESEATALSEMFVTGSEDCSIRVWRIGYER